MLASQALFARRRSPVQSGARRATVHHVMYGSPEVCSSQMIALHTIIGGRYRVVKALGGGGMKLVYLAEDLRLAARKCALAEMVDSFTSAEAQKQAISAFQREADMLA